MDFISLFLAGANSILWGWFMIVVLVGTHLYTTVRTGFIQRHIVRGIRLTFRKSGGVGDVSHFSSLMIALAATIGVGNIVGVATAVVLGGPGAVFWCWLTGILGIATKYSEAVLAVKYRVLTAKGTWLGGPMYALEKGVGSKLLAILFCIFTLLASFGIGNMTQANTFSDSLEHTFGVPVVWSGVCVALLVGVVILGGVRWIASVCRRLVPVMALLYVVCCVAILVVNFDFLGAAFGAIFRGAFSAQAVGGGAVGGGLMLAARYGIARGLFSNESGMGSAPIAAAAARTSHPAEQGLVSMTGTFWDTVVVCALTGLVVVSSMVRSPELFVGRQGVEVTYAAFGNIPWGEYFLVLSIACFTFSTLLGWSYYGERALEYLSGGRGMLWYRLVWVLLSYVGATTSLDVVWNFSDLSNALMVLPNVVALVVLAGVVKKETDSFLKK